MIPEWLILGLGESKLEPMRTWSLALSISAYSGRVQILLRGSREAAPLEGMWIGDLPAHYSTKKKK
jgi:hypothetical protein